MKQDHIRNFAIIAHVDHGKSTLSDRLLEITGTIPKDKMREQFLDQNPISRERGITIKLAPVRMIYKIPNSKLQSANNSEILTHNSAKNLRFGASDLNISNSEFIMNLIDTPGHVDFSYEVSRTLAACEGAILLVDATQGIQAQTVAHYHAAKKENLVLIPVLNKIDLPNAQADIVAKELEDAFGFSANEIMYISAKTGENVEKLLRQVIVKIPPPSGFQDETAFALRALIFDAIYDEHKGVVTYTRVVDGSVKKGDRVRLFQSGMLSEITEVGYFSPYLQASDELSTGEIGYIITGIKDLKQCRVGDTITNGKWQMANGKLKTDSGDIIEPLPGYKQPKPMVFFGMYPKDQDDIVHLRESLGKLSLNDTSLMYSEEHSAYLGSGFRVGFLGLLHAEIIKQRLAREFGLDLLLTMPQVLYQKTPDGAYAEPYMLLNVYTPKERVGNIMTLCQKRKGMLLDMQYHQTYTVLSYEMPYSMFIRGLSAEIKSVSAGFASIDYELTDYKEADLANLEVRINDNPIDVLSELVYRDEAISIAREKTKKLKDSLSRQQFRQIIQAVVNGTIVAREEISPFRKDVIAKLSGGDRTRKDKLLKKQKKGKERMLSTAKVHLPQEALFSIIEGK